MTADVDIPALLNTLAGIHERAPWAHSLAYDRPGRNLDPGRVWTTGDDGEREDRAPVGQWDTAGSITAFADTAMASNWHTMLTELRRANHDLLVALRRLRGHRYLDTNLDALPLGTPSRPRPPRHATARHIQRSCEDIIRLLRPALSWQHTPPAFANELVAVAAMIHKADDQFPAIEYDPPRPRVCADPRNNRDANGKSLCLGVPYAARNLCESCLRLEVDIAEWKAKARRARWCIHHPDEPKHAAHKITLEPLCNTCYQAAKRAGEFDNHQLVC